MQSDQPIKIQMKEIALWIAALAITCVNCNNKRSQFHITGSIIQACDSMLYLEHLSIEGLIPMDSIRLKENGQFSFHGNRPFNPEFYRLRVADRIINLSIDSTETVTVTADYPHMNTDYEVTGSPNCEAIKQVGLLLQKLQKDVNHTVQDRTLTLEDRNQKAQQLIEQYKHTIKADFILKDPAAAVAYFALFQTIGSTLIFNPVDNWEDVRYVAAVGTAWDEHYPGTPRTENLHNIAMQGMKNSRPRQATDLQIDSSKIEEVGIIDIALKDIKGTTRRLSDLKGKVVLLDFTAYSTPKSKERILQMRSLYEKYAKRGLEIYQVSFDPDEHYWKTACENLPWICVYDPDGIHSDNVVLYQLHGLPSYFIIDRRSELKARAEYISDLEKTIEELL